MALFAAAKMRLLSTFLSSFQIVLWGRLITKGLKSLYATVLLTKWSSTV